MAKHSNAIEIKNKKAAHDYIIGETFEAGVVLCGTEVKSVKLGHAQINEAFVRIDRKGRPVLFNAQIDEYAFGNCLNHDAKQQRYLLLHKRDSENSPKHRDRQLHRDPAKNVRQTRTREVAFRPLQRKKLYDKRHDLRERTEMREAERYLSNRYR